MTKPTAESIYPDFFRSGIGRLQRDGAWSGDLLTLFSALDHLRHDIDDARDQQNILPIAQRYIDGLDLFHTSGFYLVNPADFSFEMTFCHPVDEAARLVRHVKHEIRSGKFAWALRQDVPVFFQSGKGSAAVRGVFHSLGVASHRIGMFCGLLRRERIPSQELAFSLLSLIAGISSDALVASRNTAELKHQVLVAHRDLQRALSENEVLARIPDENPNPVLRLKRTGQILYGNTAGQQVLESMGYKVGDLVLGEWLKILGEAFATGLKQEFETTCRKQTFAFVVAPIVDAGYANFYGTNITARKTAEGERERLISELQEALAKVKTLSGLVPICAWCKKIRDDRGYWKQIEIFIESHSDATFSHGICPECAKKLKRRLPSAKGPTTDA